MEMRERCESWTLASAVMDLRSRIPGAAYVFTEDYCAFEPITATVWVGENIKEHFTGHGDTYAEAMRAAIAKIDHY